VSFFRRLTPNTASRKVRSLMNSRTYLKAALSGKGDYDGCFDCKHVLKPCSISCSSLVMHMYNSYLAKLSASSEELFSAIQQDESTDFYSGKLLLRR